MSTEIFTSWKLKAEVLLSTLHLLHIKNQREYSASFPYSVGDAVN